jgi:hypothetical protein
MTDKEVGLVYIEYNKKYREDIIGSTLIAKVKNQSIISGVVWYDIELLTDPGGNSIEPLKMTVRSDQWLDNRKILKIDNATIYHFTKSNTERMTSSNYIYIDNSIEKTTLTAWPSGIDGLYLENDDFKSYKINTDQIVYKIELKNPFIIQDYAHVESITSASMSTNVILDTFLLNKHLIETVDLTRILTLWNIVFYRTFNRKIIDENFLLDLIMMFINNYGKEDIKDTISGRKLNTPFINILFKSLGYDSLLNHDNSRSSLSVIFDMEESTNLKGAYFKHI